MTMMEIAKINSAFRTGQERLWFWFNVEPKLSNTEYARRTGLKNARVVSSIISRGKWRAKKKN